MMSARIAPPGSTYGPPPLTPPRKGKGNTPSLPRFPAPQLSRLLLHVPEADHLGHLHHAGDGLAPRRGAVELAEDHVRHVAPADLLNLLRDRLALVQRRRKRP